MEELISKNSNGRRYVLVPNGLGQSYIGVKGNEPIAGDWTFLFNAQNGFNPYTLERANGPKSLVQNNTTPLDAQTANGDSSRAGQLFNTVAYAGLSHPTYGTLTAGRQDSLILDGLGRYDPMNAAPAFSVIGTSNTVAGAGDTEDARYETSVQYRVNVGALRLVGLYQFGGYDQGNGSNGAIDVQVGGDFGGFLVRRRRQQGQGCSVAVEFRQIAIAVRHWNERSESDALRQHERRHHAALYGWRREAIRRL